MNTRDCALEFSTWFQNSIESMTWIRGLSLLVQSANYFSATWIVPSKTILAGTCWCDTCWCLQETRIRLSSSLRFCTEHCQQFILISPSRDPVNMAVVVRKADTQSLLRSVEDPALRESKFGDFIRPGPPDNLTRPVTSTSRGTPLQVGIIGQAQ